MCGACDCASFGPHITLQLTRSSELRPEKCRKIGKLALFGAYRPPTALVCGSYATHYIPICDAYDCASFGPYITLQLAGSSELRPEKCQKIANPDQRLACFGVSTTCSDLFVRLCMLIRCAIAVRVGIRVVHIGWVRGREVTLNKPQTWPGLAWIGKDWRGLAWIGPFLSDSLRTTTHMTPQMNIDVESRRILLSSLRTDKYWRSYRPPNHEMDQKSEKM